MYAMEDEGGLEMIETVGKKWRAKERKGEREG